MKFRVHNGTLIPSDQEALEYVAQRTLSTTDVDLEPVKAKKRTTRQNNSLHLYCSMVAKALNSAGLDMVTVLAEGTEIPWSDNLVKEHIWRKVQIAMIEKESTTDLTTAECSPIYDVVNRYLADRFGITVLWPSYLDLEK